MPVTFPRVDAHKHRAGQAHCRLHDCPLQPGRHVERLHSAPNQPRITPMSIRSFPPKQGLYDPVFEKDSCGFGFVVNIKGNKSHEIIEQALTVLVHLMHRGASGSETNTGDGSGILIQIPHAFLKLKAQELGFDLPDPQQYGVGTVFMDPEHAQRQIDQGLFERIVAEEGQNVLGWRDVPTNHNSLGPTARASEPCIRQVFIGRGHNAETDMDFERKLYVIRRRAEKSIRYDSADADSHFYISSLSCRTMIYKGMLTSEQVQPFYLDLYDPSMETALALVHSRFSTNTFPSWDRAHPYRYLAHNGEINTLRGNVNWMHARQALCESGVLGEDIEKIMPVINQDGSDSAMFDNVLEFLHLMGRPLPLAVMMMIPEPWARHQSMSDEKKAFYEFHGCLMEPWDGPASIAFTDGVQIGAVLDRNGLRPSRYYVTKDDLVIMASEVGVIDVPPERVLFKGRLQPGRMFLVDTSAGRIVSDEEVKDRYAQEKPYRQWLTENMAHLSDLLEPSTTPEPDHKTVRRLQQAFGYTFEDTRLIMAPMARDGVEPIGSMGTDTPLAALSNRPQLLYNYFKQLFAQVTNPPIDAIREEVVTSTLTTIGAEANLLNPQPESCRHIRLQSPILTNDELSALERLDRPGFKTVKLSILYPFAQGSPALEASLEALYTQADAAIADGATILILSDRDITSDYAAIPALLAISGLHHHLIRQGTRTRVGLVLESAEPREVHHFALLIGYGCGAVNPYLAFETLDDLIREGFLTGIDHKTAVKNYTKALLKGIVKTQSKMGISTIQSYRGAQIFEAVGLNKSVVDRYFTWTASRIEGVGIDVIAEEVARRHRQAFSDRPVNDSALESAGQYQWRRDGEFHLFNPETVHKLQHAVRSGNYDLFKEYSRAVNEQSEHYCTLRGLFELKPADTSVPIDEVEPIAEIVKRFKTGAMSYGSISQEAHEALAVAMNRLGGKSNTGEGGEDPSRYTPGANGDSRNSAIKQVASGRFGVTSQYLVSATELQIKMAQGAKPGEGGQLPGAKAYPWIAKVRLSTPGVGLISPPPHHDIYSIEDLAQLIYDLKNANPTARVSVKLVSEVGVGTIAAGVAKAHADVVLISGHDGGTGAAPLTSIKHVGLPWELGLAETHQTLLLNDLRSRIAVETDGQLKTGRDVVIAALLGAEEFGFATSPLVALGCVMMRVCHLNTCPVGVATQDPELRKKFTGEPEHVVNFMLFIATEMREIMAQLGFRTVQEMIGRTDRIESSRAIEHWKAQGLDLSPILYQPDVPETVGRYKQIDQKHNLDETLDKTVLLDICERALDRKEKVSAELKIRNVNRAVGTMLGSEVTRRYGAEGLPEDTIHLKFKGSAGQSFGAFAPKGLTLELEGDANDYVGKGLSGARIVVYPPPASTFEAQDNIIVGNVGLYGATSGEAYIRGMAGERFCVRNSGVHAVVEAIGDHGCEYMTGGRVVILGKTGRNFAAGMSGGIAYVLDTDGSFPSRCNQDMVSLQHLEDTEEIAEVRELIERHARLTGSRLAADILSRWEETAGRFVKVLPRDLERVLNTLNRVQESGLSGDEAIMAAFEENARDLSRVGGN